jgi:serine protease Do
MVLSVSLSASQWLRAGAVAALVGVASLASLASVGTASAAEPRAVSGLPDFTELVERVGPAVVNIRTMERSSERDSVFGQGELDPRMEEFFRRFGIPMPGNRGGERRGQQPDDEPQQRGVGSGFILTADGYVMTNAHVVEGADEVLVTLTDKREFKARIVGSDKRTDVAVVKIEASGLPTVKIGNADKLKVGEWVVAIGSPFGLESTVTAGIVSAKQRDTGDYLPLLQTDVAINPGNSGGPLLNLRGEVVGINSQIYSRSGGYMGIAFAIPIDEATRVADQLRTSGRVIRGRIGVTIGPVTKEVAESIGMGKPAGALVQSVEDGGPAQKAGIEAGDIITRVDGKTVEKSSDLPRIIGGIKPGSSAALSVFRRGKSQEIAVKVGEFEADSKPQRRAKAEGKAPAPVRNALGLAVSDLTPEQRDELKLKSGGVRVESVEGAAARAGLREGDIILTFDNAEVQDAKQFAALVAKADKSKTVSALVRRGDWTNFVVIRPGR